MRLHISAFHRSTFLPLPVCLLLMCALLAGSRASLPISNSTPQPALALPALGQLPLSFMATGHAQAPFTTVATGGSLVFQPDAVTLAHDGERVDVRFDGANAAAQITPAERQRGTISAHLGTVPAAWRDHIALYGALEYHGLYPGIDLRYDGAHGQLKGTFTVAPQTDAGAIQWSYHGATGLALDKDGNLRVTLADGAVLTEHAPVAWQDIGGARRMVEARFVVQGEQVSFALGAYDAAYALVIDPTLDVSTFLGGGSADYGRGVAVDTQGNIYVVGEFFSSDFLGDSTPTSGSTDAIILKLNPTGTELLYGFYMGGKGGDEGLAIAVNNAGEAFVIVDPGDDFPMMNAPISQPPDTGDAVLLKFDASGTEVFSTYLGFNIMNSHTGNVIDIGPDGKVYVTGQSYVALQRLGQVAIVQVNPATGAIVRQFDRGDKYADTQGASLAIDSAGVVYVAGQSFDRFGTEFPTTPDAFQAVCPRKASLGNDRDCDEDAFLMTLNPDLTLRYATFLGGVGSDDASGVDVDANGNAVIVGSANSPDFPTKNPLIATCPEDPSLELCSYDGFVTKLNPASGLVYSTYLTSGQPEVQTFVTDVAIDKNGNAFVYGFSSGETMPIKDAVQPSISPGLCIGGFNRNCFDVFITEFTPQGGLAFGTYLGGQFDEYSGSIAVDNNGHVFISGRTDSSNFPTTTGVLQPNKKANTDMFVSRISMAGSNGGGNGGGGAPGPYRVNLPFVMN